MELSVVTGEQIPERYVTLDNGGEPFLVSILSRKEKHSVMLCKWKQVAEPEEGEPEQQRMLRNYDISNPFFQDAVEKVFVGKSPLNEMTRFSGGHGPRFDGNSILLKKKGGDYIFVGHEVYAFRASEIVDFVSPVGNSSVPYPYAVDVEGRYILFIEHVVMPRPGKTGKMDDDPYRVYYDMRFDQCDFELTYQNRRMGPVGAVAGRFPDGSTFHKISKEGKEELSRATCFFFC